MTTETRLQELLESARAQSTSLILENERLRDKLQSFNRLHAAGLIALAPLAAIVLSPSFHGIFHPEVLAEIKNGHDRLVEALLVSSKLQDPL